MHFKETNFYSTLTTNQPASHIAVTQKLVTAVLSAVALTMPERQ
jgi:hypothetical protein